MTTKICIIGGSGFIGTRLTRRLLNRGHDVVILDKVISQTFPEKTVLADVRDLEALRGNVPARCVIINLAAEHRDDVLPRSLYDEVNVDGAANVCAVAREKCVNRIIFTSSVAVYGFAPRGTDESGRINPFNDYGRTKYEAEVLFRDWHAEASVDRTLVVVRPTVVFGERNRGNVYNLLRHIASGRFVMIGSGENRKSMAYVENVAAFIEHAVTMGQGEHCYNYVDKPDLSMNELAATVAQMLDRRPSQFKLPFWAGYSIGRAIDLLAVITRRQFSVSAIRVKKFCADTEFGTNVTSSGFVAPVSLLEGLQRTVRHEFVLQGEDGVIFYSE